MIEEEILRLSELNARLLLVMGYVTCVVFDAKPFVPEEKQDGINWFLKAIENLVYLDKPLPPFPGK